MARILVLIIFTSLLTYIMTTAVAQVDNRSTQILPLGTGVAQLSEEAIASISGLDDHPVEDTDIKRADRMLAALETIPYEERVVLEIDLDEIKKLPLDDRLARLQELWKMRQEELRTAYEALPKVRDLFEPRIGALRCPTSSEAEKASTLLDLEDLLADVDLAGDFHSVGGLPALAAMLEASQPEAIRELAAWAIGTAIKNEPRHQLWLIEPIPDGASTILEDLLDSVSLAETNGLRAKVLYALSAGLSNNADLQLRFGSLSGQAGLSDMYDRDGVDEGIKIRVLVLLTDLMREATSGSPSAVLALAPVGMTSNSGGLWCGRIDDALRNASDARSLERLIEPVRMFAPSCRAEFARLSTRGQLESLAERYRVLASEISDEAFAEYNEELGQDLRQCASAM